ncbi:MAG TPA: HNH endonuclease [Verrucomicrobiales bacterium]|nr:HNH endonuclease [Verrucomicrobiales bacterium]HIL71273.1 HNH endonuclease [Verrucomicrobiota bacterium]
MSKEKEKARRLRKTQWWRNEIAKGVCHYCKQSFRPEELTMDHVIPLSRDGKSRKGNVVPCCKSCNNRKTYLTPVEMILNDMDQSSELNIPFESGIEEIEND